MTMNQTISDTEFFKSSDLSAICTFCCFGYHIEHVDKTNPRRAVFYIRTDDHLEELKKKHAARELKVEPSTYFHMLKDIKTMLYQS